ncbi:acetylcholinesterase, putative [Ixodes scapularis]|uniref:Carboxylic ester hydrolase n=1 Tax=Ixodes scapularis TaxID=6945 RepID=B7PZY8_IXOSC|nr:acetylcholinesterase, putative [Ixodes scapularis]|eukprot:XP_002406496.1 acetylcholinesterase, putative [Ixodes scapularis]
MGLVGIILLATGGSRSLVTEDAHTAKHANVVRTSAGLVEGVQLTAHGRTLHAFYGIPFAEPPTGNSRFRLPTPKTPFTTVFNAKKLRAECPQLAYTFNKERINVSGWSEDCLHLNLWTPNLLFGNESLKAVVVYLHGGGFQNGGNNLQVYDGRHFAALGDVVVVVPNYRLGIFGFLYADSAQAPGNQGLWDQRLALLWVRDNVQVFGGDPARVTLMGQSSGSVSVGYHVLSPLTRHLFLRAIMQSGSPFYKIEENKITGPGKAKKLASRLCGTPLTWSTNAAVKCLREQSAQKLLRGVAQLLGIKSASFVPTFGDNLVPRNPLALMFNATIKPVELLIGINENEGSYFLLELYRAMGINDPFRMSSSQHLAIMKQLMEYALWTTPEDLMKSLLLNVREGTSIPDVVRYVAEGIGDVVVRCPTLYFSEALANSTSRIYCYEFDYRPEKGSFRCPWMGVTHFDEFPFVWGYVFDRADLASFKDMEYSERMIRLWSSFVKNG